MTDTMYSTVGDLLLGDLPVPTYMDQQKYVNDAANEIDSVIGFLYVTPVDMTDPGPVSRPARLLMTRLNTHLSSGRLLMAIATASEDTQLNAYGRYLVDMVGTTLQEIVDGKIQLPGAAQNDNGDDTPNFSGPVIANIDQVSIVESFYQQLAQPTNYYNWCGR